MDYVLNDHNKKKLATLNYITVESRFTINPDLL